MKTAMGMLCLTLAVLITAGCVSTPASRIKKEPEIFAAFPPDIQAKVQRGEIAVGFTKDMVRLAKGRPSRISSRITAAGYQEVWTYTGIRHISRMEPVDTGYWYRDRAGRLYRSYDMMWVDYGYNEEFPTLRLEFAEGKVSAIEQVKR